MPISYRPYDDGTTEKSTSRCSVLLALLSVTLISRRKSPSGNDASGIILSADDLVALIRVEVGGSVCALNFCGVGLVERLLAAASFWWNMYSIWTSGLPVAAHLIP